MPSPEEFREGALSLGKGDALILYSDGLIDGNPELGLNKRALAERLKDATSALEMVERLIALPGVKGELPDDMTVLVVRFTV